MDETKVLLAALAQYGSEAQTLMLFEEMAELQKELCKHARGRQNTASIAEEIADVQIMLEQMILLHDCREDVQSVRKFKVARLANRLRGAEDGK